MAIDPPERLTPLRMLDGRFAILCAVLRDAPDLNRHRQLLREVLVEAERAREEERQLSRWQGL